MTHRFLLIFIISVFSTLISKAEWVPFSKDKTKATPPAVTLISSDEKSTVFRVDLSGFDLQELISEGKSYQVVDLLTESHTTTPGSPLIPYLAEILAVPDQAGITVEVINTGKILTFKNMHLPPARQSQWEGQAARSVDENPEAYRSETPFPESNVLTDPPTVFRDFRIARVSVYPVRYTASKNELQITSSITIRVNYGKGPVVNPKNTPRKKIAPSYGKIYRSTILNYQEMLNAWYRGVEDGREVMLCIMPDNFYNSFQGYATWKRQTGTDVHITKFSEIGANASNPVPIKNHITDAYNNWDNPPTYVLMIGDDGKFPKKIATYPDYSFPWDEYFVTVDGLDFMPDVMVGRFTNETDYTLQVMVNKFKSYEKTPYVTDPTWFKKGVCCSNNAYVSQVNTKRFAANVMLNDGGFTSVDTLMSDGDPWSGQECTVDLDDVTSAINNGRSFLNYRGEGWDSGWSASCYYFQVQDVTGLTNSQKMPFVTSIGCGVAMFDSGNGNCFGEEWIETGTPTSPKGAACFIGPTSNTHTAYNNSIDRGIYIGMFREGMDTPGQAMMRGKLFLYNTWGVNDMWVEYHYKIYCILGDPSIHIWKDLPQLVTCNYPASINVGDNHMEVSVEHLSSGEPVNNAQVCITGAELFVTGFTNEEGVAILDFVPETEEALTITIRGGNVIPFQGVINVVRPATLVIPENDPVVDDLDGNNDNMVNPNENCSITYTLKNWGSGTAAGVLASISTTSNEFVEIITTNPVNFGSIAAGGTVTGTPFQFFVKPACRMGQIIDFQLHVTSGTLSWDYPFQTEVLACDLNVKKYVVHDFSASEPNYRLDPGETVALVLELENIGLDIASDVSGTLSSGSPYIEMIDSYGEFGSMSVNDTSLNNTNYFKFSLSPSCPAETVIDFQVLAETGSGLYPYQEILEFSIPVSALVPSGYTGPDAYGYYAYENNDAFYEQTPVFNWVEISGIGTAINTNGASEFTKTINLPFGFKYYGTTFSQIRVSTDGWIAFGSGTQTTVNNQTIPNDDNINNMVAIYWDNLFNTDYVNGDILTYNDPINHRFIVEWNGVTINSEGTSEGWATFEVILLDPAFYNTVTGDGEILMQYFRADDVISMTTGIENATQDIALLYLYNNSYHPTASEIKAGTAIKFTTNPPFESIITSVNGPSTAQPGFTLEQNKPNPFHSNTTIGYTVTQPGFVSLNIYDTRGVLVKSLFSGQQPAGHHNMFWDGSDNKGSATSPGIYFYRLQTDDNSLTMKMIRLN
ncbi:MAG: T9SS type A sorting domain-containing protein [Bacteroidales bacterium]|nr:T9SS type A sorting domain-containing protein [Bacteroidales bacterium]